MEGPSLLIASENLVYFRGKKIKVVTGNSKAGIERFRGKTVKDIFSWGKHLVFQFDRVAIRIHFLMYGSFTAEIGGKSVTGDYRIPKREARLALEFSNGNIKMYNCSVKLFETNDLKSTYDFSTSIMSDTWSSEAAHTKSKQYPDEEVADVLLDQDIFAGVGNIIKNESLFLAKINPQEKVNNISDEKLKDLIEITHKFSWQFYEWRKKFELKKHYQIYRKSVCPVCGGKVTRQITGKRARRSFWCPLDQPKALIKSH